MENFRLNKTDGGLEIEGFPDAAKVIKISGPHTKRIADLALHKSDLTFAIECLEGINQLPDKPRTLRQGLWHSAILHYMKCFGPSQARGQLSPKKIYKGKPSGLSAFNYFKDMRNKHFVHDENSYAQCIPGAIINTGDKSNKIERIITINAFGETLVQDNWANLHKLIKTAEEWTRKELDKLCDSVTNELETLSYDDLIKQEALTFKRPELADIGKVRKGH